jgi:toxin FitB
MARSEPTAPDPALDADVILAAQATEVEQTGRSVAVATTNPRHLSRFVDARFWQEIAP